MSNDITQFYRRNNELNYPFVDVTDNEDKINSLVSDIFISFFSSSKQSTAAMGLRSFVFEDSDVNFKVHIDANSSSSGVLLDTTEVYPDIENYGSYRIYKYTGNNIIVQLVINTDSDVFKNEETFSIAVDPGDIGLRIVPSCLSRITDKVTELSIRQGVEEDLLLIAKGGVDPEDPEFEYIEDTVVLETGYNVELVKNNNTITINAIPNAGKGRYNDISKCQELEEELALLSINGLKPVWHSTGRLSLQAGSCLSFYKSVPNTLSIGDRCSNCLECEEIESMYRVLRDFYNGTLHTSLTRSMSLPINPTSGWAGIGPGDNPPPGAVLKYSFGGDPLLAPRWPFPPNSVEFTGSFSGTGDPPAQIYLDDSVVIENSEGIWWMESSVNPGDVFDSITMHYNGLINSSTTVNTLINKYDSLLYRHNEMLSLVQLFKQEIDKPRITLDHVVNTDTSTVTLIVKALSGALDEFDVNVETDQVIVENSEPGKLDPEIELYSKSSFKKIHNQDFEQLEDNTLITEEGFEDTIQGSKRFVAWVWSVKINPNITNIDFEEANILFRITLKANYDLCEEGTAMSGLPKKTQTSKTIDVEMVINSQGDVYFE